MKLRLGILAFLIAAFVAADSFNSGGGGASGSGAMTQLSQQILSMAATNFTFSSITTGYTDLQITCQGRGDTAAAAVNVQVTFNGDTAAHYDYVNESGGTASAQNNIIPASFAAASNTANYAGLVWIQIPNYTGTTFIKNLNASYGNRSTTTPTLQSVTSFGEWNSTAAITSVTLTAAAGNFIAGSECTLWGIK